MSSGAAEAAGALEAHRPMLFGLAYRMVGSVPDAEDVLQDAYLRWLGADRAAVAEPRRYLTRMVSRLAIDKLRARQAARESYVGPWLPEPVPTGTAGTFGPQDSVEQRESLSIALLHLLERLSPVERAVYLLHTAFQLPYSEIASVVDRTVEDCRQLQHRAVAHIRRDRARFTASPAEQQRLLESFLAAAQDGDLPALTGLLATDATAWTDGGGRVRAALNPVYGAGRIARFFAGIFGPHRPPVRTEWHQVNAQPALVIRRPIGTAYAVTIGAAGGHITGLYLVGNPAKLGWLMASGRDRPDATPTS